MEGIGKHLQGKGVKTCLSAAGKIQTHPLSLRQKGEGGADSVYQARWVSATLPTHCRYRDTLRLTGRWLTIRVFPVIEVIEVSSRSYRTNWLLWAIVSIGIFVPMGFVDVSGISKSTYFWDTCLYVLRGVRMGEVSSEVLGGCVLELLFLGIPSVAIAWVLQAIIVVGYTRWRTRRGI